MTPVGIDEEEADARIAAIGVLESTRNVANGFAGLDDEGALIGTVTHRSGTAAEINAIVPANGELAFVTDLNEIRRGDGSTAGGILVGQSIRRFATTDGGVTLSTTGNDYAQNISCIAGAVYRLSGFFTFTGDTDNLSNYTMAFRRANGLVFGPFSDTTKNSFTALQQTQGFCSVWTFDSDTSGYAVSKASISATNALINNPPITTKAGAVVSVELIFGVATAGDFQVTAGRRTTATGTPTIKVYASYQIARLF